MAVLPLPRFRLAPLGVWHSFSLEHMPGRNQMKLHLTRRAALAISAFCALVPATAAYAQVKPQEDGDKLVCRRAPSAGSRLDSRVCLTRAEWRDRESQTREVNRTIIDGSERDNHGDLYQPHHERGGTPR
jgi:hypothetical protein